VWVDGGVGRCWRITEIITINMAAENGTGSVGVGGVNGMGLKKGILRDCGARYDDAPTNSDGQRPNKNAKFRVMYGNQHDS